MIVFFFVYYCSYVYFLQLLVNCSLYACVEIFLYSNVSFFHHKGFVFWFNISVLDSIVDLWIYAGYFSEVNYKQHCFYHLLWKAQSWLWKCIKFSPNEATCWLQHNIIFQEIFRHYFWEVSILIHNITLTAQEQQAFTGSLRCNPKCTISHTYFNSKTYNQSNWFGADTGGV